jgi:hypothetical protein
MLNLYMPNICKKKELGQVGLSITYLPYRIVCVAEITEA